MKHIVQIYILLQFNMSQIANIDGYLTKYDNSK